MGRTSDIVIVGGGVIGLTLARELRKRGGGRIAIVERGKPGQEASHAAAGMLSPTVDTVEPTSIYDLCVRSREMFPDLAAELLEETGIDIEFDRSGTLLAAFVDKDAEYIRSLFVRQREMGFSVHHLSRAETLAAEPRIAKAVRESLFYPRDWQVENRKLLTALEKSIKSMGVSVIENASVSALVVENGRITGVEIDGGLFSAKVVILATGAWTSLIKMGSVSLGVAVEPVRGQMISYARRAREFRRVIYTPRGYLVPRIDGRILVGATVENVGYDAGLTESGVSGLAECAAEIAPHLTGEPIAEHWAGLRPFANGGRPLIGPIPGVDGAYLATGHYRNGILLAPITAKMIADKIIDGATSEYFELFGLAQSGSKSSNALA